MRILVTGATGKVGQAFIQRLLNEPGFETAIVRVLCHHRDLKPQTRLEVVRGSIDDRVFVNEAVKDVTHVLHLATSKETSESIMDVAVKGMFWLLEACRTSESFQQFLMVGGDAGMGHFFYPHPVPVTEQQKHSAYPGCYALSKVLEEVMLDQYYVQYQFNGCCLRAPWIMEKDDFKYQLSFEADVFGWPRWRDIVGAEKATEYARNRTIPVPLDANGDGLRRNFVHVEDLVDAILKAINHPKAKQQTFNVCMDEPVDYVKMGEYLAKTRSYNLTRIPTEFHSTWLDNSKAKFLLGWRPKYNLEQLTDSAFDYNRAADDPRIIWYPG